MTTDELIDRITKAAETADWSRAQASFVELHRLMKDDGRALSHVGTLRLIAAMASGAPLGRAMLGGGQGASAVAELRAALDKQPLDTAALQARWNALYSLLASPNCDADPEQLRDILLRLRSLRMFDLLGKTADRILIRYPDDATARRLYGQALIDQGQLNAGIELLESVLRAVAAGTAKVDENEISEIQGLLGRAHKQIYVDHVPVATAPASERNRFLPNLQKAIDYYAKAFDPAHPDRNYWHGINLVGLLALARSDGHREISNPAGLAPEEIAQRLIDSLLPKAQSTDDPWLLSTLAEAYLTRRDFENTAKYFGEYLKRKPNTFAIAGTVRQLEEVFRINAGSEGAGPILAALKQAQIAQPEGKFTLDGDQLQQLKNFAGTPEHHRCSESMVPGGDYVQVGLLQTVVGRASAVAALCDATGATQGTGFIIRGSDLYEQWGQGLFLVTNAHVLSDPSHKAHEPSAPLSPQSVKIVLEAAGGNALQCETKARWQSPICNHDVTIVALTNPEANRKLQPLPIFTGNKLEPGDPEIPEQAKTASRVSVIGYPKGGPLSLSIVGNISGANGMLVDIGARKPGEADPVYLHYRAPTEPGNSGSPVFETNSWSVVGLHHEGFDKFDGRAKLGGKCGKSFANEGISIRSIQRAIKQNPA